MGDARVGLARTYRRRSVIAALTGRPTIGDALGVQAVGDVMTDQVALIRIKSDGTATTVRLTKPESIIGRQTDCQVRIPVAEVSRQHCRLTREGEGGLWVEDLGSRNGTLVNGRPIEGRTQLQPGDSLTAGPLTFVVQINGTPSEDEASATRLGQRSATPADEHKTQPTIQSGLLEAEGLSAPGDPDGSSVIDFDFDFDDDDEDDQPPL